MTEETKPGSAAWAVEQNVSMAFAVADYVYIISRGEIVYESEPKALSDNEKLRNKYLEVAK